MIMKKIVIASKMTKGFPPLEAISRAAYKSKDLQTLNPIDLAPYKP